MCQAQLADGPLVCVRPDHPDTGHVFESSIGSHVDDGHVEGGHG